MARIEGDNWVIESEEEAKFISDLINNPPKMNSKLKEALNTYNKLSNMGMASFPLFEKALPMLEITEDMNSKPWKYATHCLKADPYGSIFIVKSGYQQLLYIDNKWQPCSVYEKILKEIEVEFHPNIDKECNLINRNLIQYYQKILDKLGFEALYQRDTNLCNSNSMGAVPNIIAIRIVLFNNDLSFKDI